jgi:hypothetical protein
VSGPEDLRIEFFMSIVHECGNLGSPHPLTRDRAADKFSNLVSNFSKHFGPENATDNSVSDLRSTCLAKIRDTILLMRALRYSFFLYDCDSCAK